MKAPVCGAKAGRRWFRLCFRTCVRGCAALGLCLAALVLYLHEAGFPAPVRRLLTDELRRTGVEFDCEVLRLRFFGGLVAESARLRRAGPGAHDAASAKEAALGIDWTPLLSLERPAVHRLTLHQGRFVMPLPEAGPGPPYEFVIDVADARIRFQGADAWDVEWLDARTHGSRFRATGSLTNLTQARGARATSAAANSEAWKRDLLRLARAMDDLHCAFPPQLDLAFHADLRHPENSTAEARLSAGGANYGGGRIGSLLFFADLNEPPATDGYMAVSWRLEATNVVWPAWGAAAVRLTGEGEQSLTNALPRRLSWRLEAERPFFGSNRVERLTAGGATGAAGGGAFVTRVTAQAVEPRTPWAQAVAARIQADIRHPWAASASAWRPDSVSGTWTVETPQTRWAVAGSAGGRWEAAPGGGDWRDWRLWTAAATVDLTHASYRGITASAARAEVSWAAPTARLGSLEVAVDGGRAGVSGTWDTDTGRLEAAATSTLDPRRVAPLLGPLTEKWLGQFSWMEGRPPGIEARATAVWPGPGTTNLASALLDTLVLDGVVSGTNTGFRGAVADFARVPVAHSNHMWLLQDARFRVPSGEVALDYREWIRRRDYYFHARGVVDPKAAAPALGPGAVRALRDFDFPDPVEVDAEYWGRWGDLTLSGVRGALKATNVVYRGERFPFAQGSVDYTNQWVRVTDARLRHSSGPAEIGGFAYDIAGRRVYFTNASATVDPAAVARTLGPRTAKTFAPYVFDEPPAVVFGGWVPVEDRSLAADAWVDVRAPRFQWWRLKATNVVARVEWRGTDLLVTNAAGGFHGGRFVGNLAADLANPDDPFLRFDTSVTDAQLHPLLEDVTGRTNRLEGLLSGHVAAAVHATTNGAWEGRGSARLRDGLVWDMPLFGGLSSIFDQITPGLGQTRFTSGTATFSVTGREVRTKDFELRSPAMRLELGGRVDFEGRVDGHIEAELLRDLPLVGPLVSLALKPFTKLFEYKVQGTLGKPEFGMKYVPSFMLAPLRPFHWIKVIFSPAPGGTNAAAGAPAVSPPPPPAAP